MCLFLIFSLEQHGICVFIGEGHRLLEYTVPSRQSIEKRKKEKMAKHSSNWFNCDGGGVRLERTYYFVLFHLFDEFMIIKTLLLLLLLLLL